MASTSTTYLELFKPTPGTAEPFRASDFNDNMDKIDAEAAAIDERVTIAEADIVTIEGNVADLQAALPAAAEVTTVSGTTYSLLSTDANDMLRFTSSSDVTFTIDDVLDPAQYVNCVQDASGKVSFVAGTGVTLQSPSGATVRTSSQYAWASVICIAAGQYRIVGNIEAIA